MPTEPHPAVEISTGYSPYVVFEDDPDPVVGSFFVTDSANGSGRRCWNVRQQARCLCIAQFVEADGDYADPKARDRAQSLRDELNLAEGGIRRSEWVKQIAAHRAK